MNSEQLQFAEKLELQWFFGILPKKIYAMIEDRYHVEGSDLVITCDSQKHAWQLQCKTFAAIFLTRQEYKSSFKQCIYRAVDGSFVCSLIPIDRTGLKDRPYRGRRYTRRTLKDFE